MRFSTTLSTLFGVAALGLLSACSPQPQPAAPVRHSATGIRADDIPVAHTPAGGYGNSFPAPVLARCTEPLVDGAPDLRGIWKAIRVQRGDAVVPDTDRLYNYVERIEQCGNRIVDMGGGTIADGRADGTPENAIHDVLVFDYKTPIHVIVRYEEGTTYVLQPMLVSVIARTLPSVNIPWSWLPFAMPGIKVTRRLDAQGHMVWTRPDQGFVMTLQRIGGPNDPYTRRDLPDSTTGGSGLPLVP
ncbi:MAG: hypothetical protein QE279_11465 [Rhodoferax sp.]|nr:hypothetical protein [Rhodoferax sp.]